MYHFKCPAMILCVVFLVGCTTFPLLDNRTGRAVPPRKAPSSPKDYVPIDQVQIASRFASVEVTRESLENEINKCLYKTGANPNTHSNAHSKAYEDFPSDNFTKMTQSNSANAFLLRKTTAVCLQTSSEKFPIYAAEAFFETVNPEGVPPDVADGWYKQIALLIATKGEANVAYVLGNGNAFIASYWIEAIPNFKRPQTTKTPSSVHNMKGFPENDPYLSNFFHKGFPFMDELYYSSVLTEKGSWETEKLDAKFSHPSMTSVTEIKRSGLSKKSDPLMHRFKSEKKEWL
jgi:hypothetical protein